jgi:hypothetical protein
MATWECATAKTLAYHQWCTPLPARELWLPILLTGFPRYVLLDLPLRWHSCTVWLVFRPRVHTLRFETATLKSPLFPLFPYLFVTCVRLVCPGWKTCFMSRLAVALLGWSPFLVYLTCMFSLMLCLRASSKQRSLSLYAFLFYMHLFHVSSNFYFFCLARCSFRLFPNFRCCF